LLTPLRRFLLWPTCGTEFLKGSTLACEIFLIALADVLAHFAVLELQVVLKLVNIHHASDRDAVLLKDEVFLS